MATEEEVIKLVEQKMKEAKQELIKEFSDYLDWHLQKYGLTPVTKATQAEWRKLHD